MILRFEATNPETGELEYLAFHTKNETYTFDGDFVRQGECRRVTWDVLCSIMAEISFNGWDYSGDLSPVNHSTETGTETETDTDNDDDVPLF